MRTAHAPTHPYGRSRLDRVWAGSQKLWSEIGCSRIHVDRCIYVVVQIEQFWAIYVEMADAWRKNPKRSQQIRLKSVKKTLRKASLFRSFDSENVPWRYITPFNQLIRHRLWRHILAQISMVSKPFDNRFLESDFEARVSLTAEEHNILVNHKEVWSSYHYKASRAPTIYFFPFDTIIMRKIDFQIWRFAFIIVLLLFALKIALNQIHNINVSNI